MAKIIQLYGSKAGRGFELDVTLHGVTPAIWRRLRVAASLTLRELHHVLQISVGWDDTHLHEFHIADSRYGMVLPNEKPIPDEREFRLESVLSDVRSFEYVYDFGDHWVHDLSAKPVSLPARSPKAECLDGERAAPLEDCGGPDSYMDLLKAIGNTASERGRDLLEWAGPDFAPLKFDLNAINRELRAAGTKAFLRKRERLYEGN
jgi:pRiA4b ORF-3-like protein